MATIRTAINMTDNLSPIFRSINSALQLTVSGFENLEGASGNAIDVSRLQQAQRELAKVDKMFEQIEKEIRDADNTQRQFNNRIRDGTEAMDSLVNKVFALIGAYLSLRGVGQLVTLSDGFTGTNARIASINDGMQTTAELQQMIFDSAQRTFTPYMQAADTVAKLAINAGHAFSNTNEIVAFTELLNKSFANANTNAEGIASATLQLNQAMGSGVLRGEELNAVLEAAPGIVQNIEKYLGISRTQLKKMASDGQITADVVKNAMFAAAEDINAMFDSMPLTWSQIWISFKNEALKAFQPLLQQINNIANSERFEAFRTRAVQTLETIGIVASWVFDKIIDAGAVIYDNWSWISPVILGVAAALGVYTIALGIHAAVTWIATFAAKEFFKALLRNPLFWIALAIGIVVAAIYKWIQSVGGIKIAWMIASHVMQSAMDALKIAFFIGINWILNLFDKLSLGMKAIGIGIQNIVGNMKVNVLTILQDMVNDAIGIINNFIAAVNAISGANIELVQEVTFGAGAAIENEVKKQGREADFLAYRNEIENKIAKRDAEMDTMIKAAAEDFKTRDAAIKAAQKEANQKSKTEGKNPVEDAINNALAMGDKIDTGNDAAKKTAKNTGKMADGVKFLNDELKYLRDLAEREAINRYTTAEIHIDNRSENHINSELDIDGIVDRFGEKVEEVAEKLAEGAVYDV